MSNYQAGRIKQGDIYNVEFVYANEMERPCYAALSLSQQVADFSETSSSMVFEEIESSMDDVEVYVFSNLERKYYFKEKCVKIL